MAKKYYKNTEKSQKRLEEHISNSYPRRKEVCLQICKIINANFDVKSYIMYDAAVYNTLVAFEDNSSILLYQDSKGVFDISEKVKSYSKAHQFFNIVRYLCQNMYQINEELCEKVYIGENIVDYIDINYLKSLYIDDKNMQSMFWKKNGFQDTEMTITEVKERYSQLFSSKIKPLYLQAKYCLSLINQFRTSIEQKKINSDMPYLATMCGHASGTVGFNDFFIDNEFHHNPHVIPWDFFWNTIDNALMDQNYEISSGNIKFVQLLNEIKNCHFHINTYKVLQ
jgi:hypothetical protein